MNVYHFACLAPCLLSQKNVTGGRSQGFKRDNLNAHYCECMRLRHWHEAVNVIIILLYETLIKLPPILSPCGKQENPIKPLWESVTRNSQTLANRF